MGSECPSIAIKITKVNTSTIYKEYNTLMRKFRRFYEPIN